MTIRYLAAIMDAWSRRITGYTLGRRIDARLTLAALATAIESGNRFEEKQPRKPVKSAA